MELNIENYIDHHYPKIESVSLGIKKPFFSMMKNLFHENQVNDFLIANRHKDSFAFIEAIIDYFDIDILLHQKELGNIPSYGRLVIVANHPLGALDAIALLHCIKEVRKDIKIVANSFLSSLENMKELLIPIDNIHDKMDKTTLNTIYQALAREEAIIIFPAGAVSRIQANGVKDSKWKNGFYKIASKMHAPILPIYIHAKNSKNFYLLSLINQSLATVTLPHEMFKFKGKKIEFKIDNAIPYSSYHLPTISTSESVKLLRKHFYRIAKDKKGLLKRHNQIAMPELKAELKQALKEGQELGATKDGKKIILYTTLMEDCVLREIGRLREISFRHVGEGSGNKRDIDRYDFSYKHIIVWDEESLEIAGAYRIGLSREIIASEGIEGLYTSTLFEYDAQFHSIFTHGIELGRSFVQPRYWNSRALDYLWQGVGAYIRKYPSIRYLFGSVSLSDSFTQEAKDMLIFFYTHYFSKNNKIAHHKDPYTISTQTQLRYKKLFTGFDYREDLRILKEELSLQGFTIPTLYKQYSELCSSGGVEFMDFGYDQNFNNCVDGLIVVDITQLKPNKKARYIDL